MNGTSECAAPTGMESTRDRSFRLPDASRIAVACACLACCSPDSLWLGRNRDLDGGAGGRSASVVDGSPTDNPSSPSGQLPIAPTAPPRASDPTASTPMSIDMTGPDNPAGLSANEVSQLVAGGPLGKLRWLYPYDGTVFPGGSMAPTLMWEGDVTTDAVYVAIKAAAFEYKAVLKPGSASSSATPIGQMVPGATAPPQPQLLVPQEIWDIASQQAQGKTDTFTIELCTRDHAQISGPIVSHFTIAPGTAKGSIYYTSYVSRLLGANNNLSGALLRIPPRGNASVLLSDVDGACAGCHAIAANGARLIALTLKSSEPPTKGIALQLDPFGAVINPKTVHGGNAGLVALYPDGSKYLAQAQQKVAGSWELYTSTDALFTTVTTDATLYDVETTQAIPDTNIPTGALMPMFSPDASRLVFNDFALGMAHGIAIMNYDPIHDKASGYRALVQEDANGAMRPGWPCFLPDNHGVVFVRTDSTDFGGTKGDLSAGFMTDPNTKQTMVDDPSTSDLYIADEATGQVTLLAKAMGFPTPQANAETYLPFKDDDVHHNYNPTITPVASGGYFWLYFDSLRNYGNLGLQRAIWGSAIDIRPDGSYTADPSHPPFYVAGQEFGADNHRAFSARDLCHADNEACASGIDCCSGFCSASAGEPDGVCTPPKQRCANRDEHCTTGADCCDPSDYCINGFCALVDLQ